MNMRFLTFFLVWMLISIPLVLIRFRLIQIQFEHSFDWLDSYGGGDGEYGADDEDYDVDGYYEEKEKDGDEQEEAHPPARHWKIIKGLVFNNWVAAFWGAAAGLGLGMQLFNGSDPALYLAIVNGFSGEPVTELSGPLYGYVVIMLLFNIALIGMAYSEFDDYNAGLRAILPLALDMLSAPLLAVVGLGYGLVKIGGSLWKVSDWISRKTSRK